MKVLLRNNEMIAVRVAAAVNKKTDLLMSGSPVATLYSAPPRFSSPVQGRLIKI